MGMNSGIKSIGEAIQTAANPSQNFELRETLASRSSPRKRTRRFGINVASSRAFARWPTAISTRIAASQILTAMMSGTRKPRLTDLA